MELIMYSSIIASIVICAVGLLKIPFIKYKEKKCYKAIFTLLTIFLIIGMSVIVQLFIINEPLLSIGMLYLVLISFGETMLTYNGIYEGLGVKDLAKKLVNNIANLMAKSPESKLVKHAEKYGLNEAIEHLTMLAHKKKVQEESDKAKEEINPVEVN